MHLLQRIYRGVILPQEIDRRAITAALPAMRTVAGFLGYTTVDFGGGVFATFTLYAGREQAETVTAAVPGVIRSSLSDLIPRPPELRQGSVLSSHRTEEQAGVMVMRRYAGCDDAAELDRRIAQLLLPRFAVLPGFQGYSLVDEGGGYVTSLNLFGTAEDAEVLDGLAAPLVRRHLSDLLPLPPETMTGRVLSEIRA